jgi:hypothetical protein
MFYFGTFSLLGFLFNPLFAPLFVFLGSKIGLFGLTLYLVGADPSGWILQFAVWSLSVIKNISIACSTHPYAAIELRSSSQVVFAIILVCGIGYTRGTYNRA